MVTKRQLLSARKNIIKAKKSVKGMAESVDKNLNNALEYIEARIGGW